MTTAHCSSHLHAGDRSQDHRGDRLKKADLFTLRLDARSLDLSKRPHSREMGTVCGSCLSRLFNDHDPILEWRAKRAGRQGALDL
jgi:hypothetical protein